MEDKDEVLKGEFVWKIDNFLKFKEEFKKSSEFKIGKFDFLLAICEFGEIKAKEQYLLILEKVSSAEYCNYNIFCKVCLIDGCGAEVLVTNRARLNFKDYKFLMIFSYSDLCCEGYDLLPEEVISLRVSWRTQDSNQQRGTNIVLDFNSEKDPSKHLQTLSENFGRFYESKVDTDFLMRIGATQIPVHRAVLSARSEVFAAMFRHDTSENRTGVVDIPDVDANVFSDVLYYVYSGKTRGMSADTVVPMYIVADKYALIELRDECLDVLMHSLSVENVCDAAQLAYTHGETQLEKQVVQFVKDKMEEIEETDKWKELLKSKASLAVKLLRSALKVYKDEVKDLSSK